MQQRVHVASVKVTNVWRVLRGAAAFQHMQIASVVKVTHGWGVHAAEVADSLGAYSMCGVGVIHGWMGYVWCSNLVISSRPPLPF